MASADSTCWTVLRDAAAGSQPAREQFAARYAPMVRAYLAARWRGLPVLQELDDALQEVFVECLRDGGLLDRASADRPGGFRAFLYGAVRNVALRVEARRARHVAHELAAGVELEQLSASEEALSRVFDRAWAKTILREAADRQAELASGRGDSAQRRVELLRLRFHEDLPIREIAERWHADPRVLHHEYARARAEFRAALLEVMTYYHPGSPADAERECAELLALLE